jgi:alpha-glucoside transport system permease protein
VADEPRPPDQGRPPEERQHRLLTDEQREKAPEHAAPGAAEAAPGGEQAVTPGPGTQVKRPSDAAEHEATPQPPEATGGGINKLTAALVFLAPAILVLGALIVYPTVYTIWRSFYGPAPSVSFVGLDNFARMFTDDTTLTAVKNNFVWVLVAPTLATAIGLVFAVLIDRVRLQTAFKTVLFMPMAISFLAVGIIFRLVYQADPDIGLANAMVTGVKSLFNPAGAYPGANPSVPDRLETTDEGGFATTSTFSTGDEATIGLVGIRRQFLPQDPTPAAEPPPAGGDQITGTVWFDFSPQGERGTVDEGERGLPGIPVEAVRDRQVVASASTADDGTFTIEGLEPGDYTVRLGAASFAATARGIDWLGAQNWLWVSAATWSVIGAFIWMWAGFAMIIISAGLASIPREVMESARVDGATEWQVFRRVTAPLLRPVILVVLVTLMINVLKIFDLVLIMAPGSVQDDATVLALRMWRVSFGGGGDHGLGSAITVFLFLLVIPAMLFNLKRFRTGE